MALELKPMAAIESIGIDPKAVVEKLDPRGMVERLDPRPLVDKVDAHALVNKLDPRVKPARARRSRRMWLFAIVGIVIGGTAVAVLLRKRSSSSAGTDTATGTDPNAKYDRAGYEDKSLGQAVNADMDLVDTLVEQEGGDMARAEQRFAQESSGAPALHRQARGA